MQVLLNSNALNTVRNHSSQNAWLSRSLVFIARRYRECALCIARSVDRQLWRGGIPDQRIRRGIAGLGGRGCACQRVWRGIDFKHCSHLIVVANLFANVVFQTSLSVRETTCSRLNSLSQKRPALNSRQLGRSASTAQLKNLRSNYHGSHSY